MKVLCFEIMFLEHRHQCNPVEKLADCQYGSLVFIFDSYSSFQRAHSALTYVRLFILIIPSEVDFKVHVSILLGLSLHFLYFSRKVCLVIKILLQILINHPEKTINFYAKIFQVV